MQRNDSQKTRVKKGELLKGRNKRCPRKTLECGEGWVKERNSRKKESARKNRETRCWLSRAEEWHFDPCWLISVAAQLSLRGTLEPQLKKYIAMY
jgi:hypothetical protein